MRLPSRLLFPLAALFASTFVVVACSSTTVTAVPDTTDAAATPTGDASTPEPEEDSAVAAPFKLTSKMLAEGATFDKVNSCNGAETSPDFAWGPGPEGTKSYAIVFNDETLDFLHGVTYDIPATVNALPAAIENKYEPSEVPGMKQSLSYKTGRYGYAGPCAPKPNEDTYEFVLYALKVETLAGLTDKSTRAAVETEVKKQMLKSTKLKGKYKQP